MDAQDKIIEFNNLNDLQKAIAEDAITNDVLARRYPIRFIILDNFKTFTDVTTFLLSKNVRPINLEDLISEEDPDEWITVDMIKGVIKNCKESSLITPFSELVRFYDDKRFRGFFNEVNLFECKKYPNIRIYLPIIGLENRFTDFLRHFGRIQESAPIWKYNTGKQTVNVFLTKLTEFKIPQKKDTCVLHNLREWLKFWKTTAPKDKVICQSKPLFAYDKYARPDNIFIFNKISNAYDFIVNFYELNIPIVYKQEEEEFWKVLLSYISNWKKKNFNFTEFIKEHFNKISFGPSEALETWGSKSSSKFDRWILKGFLESSQEIAGKPYFSLCLSEIQEFDKPENLFVAIAERIFYGSGFSDQQKLQFAKERRDDMRSEKALFRSNVPQKSQEWIKDKIIEKVKAQSNLSVAINLCTGCFDFEKNLFLGWYANHETNGFSFNELQEYYPDLSNYLKAQKPINLPSNQSWAIDYMRVYRDAKVKDKLTDGVLKTISEKNCDANHFYEWYHSFKNEHELLAMSENDERLRPDCVYWLDGLGAEYFSAVRYFVLAEHSNLKIIYSEIGRADIPSSTDLNRFEGENVHHELALDEKGHDSHFYKPFQTLIEELDIIRGLIHKIINDNRTRPCTIAIVSDHGMTAISRKAKSKKYNDAEHEGRFIRVQGTKGENDKDYIFHTNETNGQLYKIALNHSSIGKAPVHEVHGGCTPEEVLVPFFILSNKKDEVQDYKVTLVSDKVAVSEGKITVEIMPEPTSVQLTYNSKQYEMKRNGTQWSAIVDNPTEGVHKFTILPEGGYNKELEIEFYGIGFSNSDIDNLFDNL